MTSPTTSNFRARDAYERVRAWAEDHNCFCSHRNYGGPAGLAGAILGLLEDRPEFAALTDAELTVAAVHAHYGEDRRWWNSTYIGRRYDKASSAVWGSDDDWRQAYVADDDARRQMTPWWRAAAIVEDAHVQLLCAGVDLQYQALHTGRAPQPREFSVASLLHHGFGHDRGRWPGPYRHFPQGIALEAFGEYPRLLHGSYRYPGEIADARELDQYMVFPSNHAVRDGNTGELEMPEHIW